jgi:acyl-CoA thioesterase-1
VTLFLVNVARASDPTILVLGDSLSASHGFAASQGWVNLLERRLQEQGFPHQVVNASISGDTSQGGLARLPAALERHRPDIVILELGGNDGLRGVSLNTLEKNLAAIIELSQRNGAQVLLAEMRIPPNYGPRYTQKFQSVYQNLANEYDITLIPFLLEGVADSKKLMQNDGIHPRAEAQPQILDNVWSALLPILDETREVSKTQNPAIGEMITGKSAFL